MRWFFQASVSECSNTRICCLLLCILLSPSRFQNPRHSHHIGSSAHLGVPCLRPSIYNFHMRSFVHLGVVRLCNRIPITHPEFLSLPVAVLLQTFIVIKVLCFSTMYISSVPGGKKASDFFTNHLQSTDGAGFQHVGRNKGQG